MMVPSQGLLSVRSEEEAAATSVASDWDQKWNDDTPTEERESKPLPHYCQTHCYDIYSFSMFNRHCCCDIFWDIWSDRIPKTHCCELYLLTTTLQDQCCCHQTPCCALTSRHKHAISNFELSRVSSNEDTFKGQSTEKKSTHIKQINANSADKADRQLSDVQSSRITQIRMSPDSIFEQNTMRVLCFCICFCDQCGPLHDRYLLQMQSRNATTLIEVHKTIT